MEGCAIDALMLDLSAKHSTGINEPNRPETPRPSAKADAYPTTHELRTMQQFCKQLRRFASMQPTEEMLRNNPSCKTPPAHIASDPEFEILCAGADLWRQWRVQGEGRAATNSRDFKRIDFDVAVKHHGDILVSIFKEACEAWKCISTNKALGKFRGNVHDLNFFEEGLFECMSVGTCPAVRQIMEDSDEGY